MPIKEIKINPEKNIWTSRKKQQQKPGVIFNPRSTIKRKTSKVFCFLPMLVCLMKDEEIFGLNKLPLPKYAASWPCYDTLGKIF